MNISVHLDTERFICTYLHRIEYICFKKKDGENKMCHGTNKYTKDEEKRDHENCFYREQSERRCEKCMEKATKENPYPFWKSNKRTV